MLPKPINLTDIRLNGFAGANAYRGQDVPILVRAGLTSDEPEFHLYMKGVTGILSQQAKKLNVLLSWNSVNCVLLVIHEDGTAELYLQNIPMELEVLSKHDINAGEVVYQSSVADVRRVRIPGLELKPTDGVLFCFQVGWKFALFFDLRYDTTLDSDRMEREVGRLYRFLSFQELYETLGDRKLFKKLIDVGWFPFVEIIGGDIEKLVKAHQSDFNVDAEEQTLLQKFDDERINCIAQRWWKRSPLADRKAILDPALDAFKRGDSVSCLKIILTEIEGIIQDVYRNEFGKGTSSPQLLKYASERGVRKTGDEASLFFPVQFLDYLSGYTLMLIPLVPLAQYVVTQPTNGGRNIS